MSENALSSSAPTCDSFLGGRLTLRQPRRGHRAGTDAVLLAAAVPAAIPGLVLDIGSGVGAAGLAIAVLRPRVVVGLVEVDPTLASLADENLALNKLTERGHVHVADIVDSESRRRAGLLDGRADVVVTNPPFFDPVRARHSPDSAKRAAHVMPSCGPQPLAAWIGACIALLAQGGLFVMIHRPEAMATILAACKGLGGLTLLAVHPQPDKPASRILVRGRKGSRADLLLAPPLILHAGERFTPEAEAIHRGDAMLAW